MDKIAYRMEVTINKENHLIPEIPDLNIFRNNLSEKLVGQKLTGIITLFPHAETAGGFV